MKWIRVAALTGALTAGVLFVHDALGSRNSSGTMSSVNGPYVTGTVISSTTLNARFSDLETELTASLERSGKGGMLAALRGTDGTVTAPAFSWTSETGSGQYRIGSSNVGFAISGAKVGEWTANGYLSANGAVATPSFSFSNDTGSGLYRIGSNNIGFAINGTKRQEWTTTGTIVAGTTTLGASGTAISQSGRGTASLTPAAINSQQCQTQSITIAGATSGTECAAGIPAGGLGSLSFACNITSATACTLYICNPTTGSVTPPAGTYTCRYFNP